jgi:hypothetical protein
MKLMIGIDLARLYRASKPNGWRPAYPEMITYLHEQFRSELEPNEELDVTTVAYGVRDLQSSRQESFLDFLQQHVDELRVFGQFASTEFTAEFLADLLRVQSGLDAACFVTDDPIAFRVQRILDNTDEQGGVLPLTLAFYGADMPPALKASSLFTRSDFIDLDESGTKHWRSDAGTGGSRRSAGRRGTRR